MWTDKIVRRVPDYDNKDDIGAWKHVEHALADLGVQEKEGCVTVSGEHKLSGDDRLYFSWGWLSTTVRHTRWSVLLESVDHSKYRSTHLGVGLCVGEKGAGCDPDELAEPVYSFSLDRPGEFRQRDRPGFYDARKVARDSLKLLWARNVSADVPLRLDCRIVQRSLEIDVNGQPECCIPDLSPRAIDLAYPCVLFDLNQPLSFRLVPGE